MSKVLCYTISYNRPYHLYNTINNILNQSYKEFDYSIKINLDKPEEKKDYEKLLQDFKQDPRLKIIYSNNSSQQENYITAINHGIANHDIFVKIDDDDIYCKNYLETGIKLFTESQADIISFRSYIHINNQKIYDKISSIGMWNGDINQKIEFGMPPTYFFNRKAFELIKNISNQDIKKIHLFEDAAWRTAWRKNNLKSIIYDDEIFIYNIHGKNISSQFLYDKNQKADEPMDNEYFALYEFRHPNWKSYVYINKRNNRLYNINNDDHGSYKILDTENIEIKWDSWGTEKFKKIKYKNYFEKYNG